MPMTETDYSQELIENSKVAPEAAKSAQSAEAAAGQEALEYAQRLEEEAAEIPDSDSQGKEIALEAAAEARTQAQAAQEAAALAQQVWQEMLDAYGKEQERKSSHRCGPGASAKGCPSSERSQRAYPKPKRCRDRKESRKSTRFPTGRSPGRTKKRPVIGCKGESSGSGGSQRQGFIKKVAAKKQRL